MSKKQQGFSLVQVSLMLAVGGIILGSLLPGGQAASEAKKAEITNQRMKKIEEATQRFMAANGRRPCPADGTLAPTAAAFGKEASNGGACSPASTTSVTGTTVSGFSIVTAINTMVGVYIGAAVSGTGIPTGSFVAALDQTNSTITLNTKATASGSGVALTLTNTATNFALSTTATGGTTNGLKTVTIASTVGLMPGTLVTGSAGIDLGTRIRTVDSATQITLDRNATATGSPTLTFPSSVAGSVPVVTLGLPDEYGIDGWGRRIMYVVDARATYKTSCAALQNANTKGIPEIQSAYSADTTNTYDNVMWALISYGKDGHGAFPAGGSAIADRINSGASDLAGGNDTDTLTNAFVTSGFVTSYLGKIIRKTATSTFDDVAWYNEATKNTCGSYSGSSVGIGKSLSKSANLGFTLGGTGLIGSDYAVNIVFDTGDINGDGITDLVYSSYGARYAAVIGTKFGDVYVIYGSKTGLPAAGSGFSTFIPSTSTGTLNGYNGFVIRNDDLASNSRFGQALAVGDVNGDGYDDIFIAGRTSGTGTINSHYLFFGRAANSTNLVNATTLLGTVGATFRGETGLTIGAADIGDVNGDGYDDIVFVRLRSSTNTVVNVILGRPTSGGSAPNWANFGSGTTPVNISSTGTASLSTAATTDQFWFRITGEATYYNLGTTYYNLAVGDINGDGYDDIAVGSSTSTGYTNKAVYVIFGRTTANWSTDGGSPPNIVLTTELATATKARAFTLGSIDTGEVNFGNRVAIAELNNDGYEDLIISSSLNTYVFYGRANNVGSTTINSVGGTATAAVNIAANLDGTNGFKIDGYTNVTAGSIDWNQQLSIPGPNGMLAVGDVNNDGWNDIVLSTRDSINSDQTTIMGSTFVLFRPTTGWPALITLQDDTDYLSYETGDPINTLPSKNPNIIRINGVDSANTVIPNFSTGYGDLAFIPAFADLNKDGKTDIIIGSTYYGITGTAPFDRVYVLYGRTAWDPVISLDVLNQ